MLHLRVRTATPIGVPVGHGALRDRFHLHRPTPGRPHHAGRRSLVVRCGWWVSAALVVTAFTSFATAVSTPPRSGPSCTSACVSYPYTDVAAFAPRDYVWMYPAMLMALLVTLFAVCLHIWVPTARRLLTAVGVSLTIISAAALVVDYALQLTVVQAALGAGEVEGLTMLSQYNPHGAFVGLENVGYATLAAAFVFLGVSLVAGADTLVRASGWVLATGGVAILAALVLFAVRYGSGLEYRFEVVALMVTWLTLTIVGILMATVFATTTRDTMPVRQVSRSAA